MNKISLSLRDVLLASLILAAIGHADLDASLTTVQPHFAGLGRLGRDLVRRPTAEEVAGLRNRNDLLPPPANGR